MMPRAGGQYVYLREAYSPLVGFLFGWTQFLVIQTGTIAAVAIGFARYLGVLVPGVSAQRWIVEPIDLTQRYAVSLSVQQATAIALIAGLTLLNTRGLRLGKLVQNAFTWAKSAHAARAGGDRHPDRAQRGCGRGELSRRLDAARCHHHHAGLLRSPGDQRGDRSARPLRRRLRRARRIDLRRRRLEQRHLHRRRGQEPAPQRATLAGLRHAAGDDALRARQRRLPLRAADRAHPARARRSRRHRRARGRLRRARRRHHGGRDHRLDRSAATTAWCWPERASATRWRATGSSSARPDD